MTEKPINVLFLCKRNSARSIIAEALLNRHGNGRFNAFSAGIEPSSEVHPYATELLQTMNHATDFAKAKDISDLSDQKFDFVFSVCETIDTDKINSLNGEEIYADWTVPDPVDVQGSDTEKHLAFSDAYRMLNNRISIFVNLPLDLNEKEKLKKRLEDIAK